MTRETPQLLDRSGATSFRMGFSWTLAANIGLAASQWAILVVFARLGSPDAVGEYALALAITAPIVLFAGLSLRTVQASDSREVFGFGDYLGLRLITMALALAAIVGISSVAGYELGVALTVVFVGAGKAMAAVMDVFHGLFQRHRAMDLVARSVLLYGGLSLAVLALTFWATGSVASAAAASVLGPVMALLVYDVPRARRFPGFTATALRGRDGWRTYVRLARLAAPLGLSAGLMSLAVSLPRFALEQEFGKASLGVFSALAYFMVAGSTVVSALAEVALPILSDRHAADDLAGYRQLMRRLVTIGVLLGVGWLAVAAAAGPAILSLMYGPEYAQNQDAFVWLAVATGLGFVGFVLDAGIAAARRFLAQGMITVSFFVAMLFGSLALVPDHGILGAAWAVAAAMTVQTAIRVGVIARIAWPAETGTAA